MFNVLQATGSKIQPSTSTIIIGVIAVISTYISTLAIDRLGRKILLLFSVVAMGICTLLIGEFFYLKKAYSDVSFIVGLIPLISLCVFIITFSMGFGPIPWLMMGEIFPSQIKGKILCTKYFSIAIITFIMPKKLHYIQTVYYKFYYISSLVLASFSSSFKSYCNQLFIYLLLE